MDNHSVLLLSYSLEGMNDIVSVQKRKKGSKTNSLVLCPKVIKLYNSGMGEVDLMDQHTAEYRLDRKLSVRFYLCIFFDLIDIICVSSYLIYNMKHTRKLSLLDYKIVVAKNLIQYHQGWKKALPMLRPSKRKNQPESIDNHGRHLPDYQTMRKRCAYCAMEVIKNRAFVICLMCNIPLCLVKKKKLFSKTLHLGVHIIYTSYIFAKTLYFFVWFLHISKASLRFLCI